MFYSGRTGFFALLAVASIATMGAANPAQGAAPTAGAQSDSRRALPITGDIDATSSVALILNRWEPVAMRAGAHSASWRELYGTQLSLMPKEWLKMFLALQPSEDAARAKASYNQFTHMFVSAQANIVDDAVNQREKTSLKLGTIVDDQVFVAIAPCRVADTRLAGGPITAGSTRALYWWSNVGGNSWSGQGGVPGASNTVCPGTVINSQGGTLGNVAPSSAMATITTVNATTAGNFIVWNGVGAAPTASALNWDHAGEIVANTTLIPGGNPATTFAIKFNAVSGQTDVVVDIVGYFVPNHATALSCIETAYNSFAFNQNGGVYQASPSCPNGYTIVGGQCSITGSGWLQASGKDAVNPSWNCFAYVSSFPETVSASAVCCRVPGY